MYGTKPTIIAPCGCSLLLIAFERNNNIMITIFMVCTTYISTRYWKDTTEENRPVDRITFDIILYSTYNRVTNTIDRRCPLSKPRSLARARVVRLFHVQSSSKSFNRQNHLYLFDRTGTIANTHRLTQCLFVSQTLRKRNSIVPPSLRHRAIDISTQS